MSPTALIGTFCSPVEAGMEIAEVSREMSYALALIIHLASHGFSHAADLWIQMENLIYPVDRFIKVTFVTRGKNTFW